MLTDDQIELKNELLAEFKPAEIATLEKHKWHILLNLVIGRPVTKQSNFNPTREEIIAALNGEEVEGSNGQQFKGRRVGYTYGVGKDSSTVMTGVRIIQLMILEEYGVTFYNEPLHDEVPQSEGVYDNMRRGLEKLQMLDDPWVRIKFVVDRNVIQWKQGDAFPPPLPQALKDRERANILVNGHTFSAQGRQTFCGDCNMGLAGFTVDAITADGGVDIYMSGDALEEINAQARRDVPRMLEKFNIPKPEWEEGMTIDGYVFKMLDMLGRKRAEIVHGTKDAVEAGSVDYKKITGDTIYMPFFNKTLRHASKDRMHLFETIGLKFDTVMFGFTETDCGNPRLMAHLFGLIGEHAHGWNYADSVRFYAETHVIPIMKEKEFPEELMQEMSRLYFSDEALAKTRRDIEQWALKNYGLTHENLVAMVYAPFTQINHPDQPYRDNLNRWINYLVESGKPNAHYLHASKDDICVALRTMEENLTPAQKRLTGILTELTGLTFNQMQRLSWKGLAENNFLAADQNQKSDTNTEMLRDAMRKDGLYVKQRQVSLGGKQETMWVSGR